MRRGSTKEGGSEQEHEGEGPRFGQRYGGTGKMGKRATKPRKHEKAI